MGNKPSIKNKTNSNYLSVVIVDQENEDNNNNNSLSKSIIISKTEFSHIDLIWFDENSKSKNNQKILEQFKPLFNRFKEYTSIDEGFKELYKNEYKFIYLLISGRLFGKFIKKLKENLNEIIVFPYIIIFTSSKYQKDLLNIINNKETYKEKYLSYDSFLAINHPFYNKGGIISSISNIKSIFQTLKYEKNNEIKTNKLNKLNYEDIFCSEIIYNQEETFIFFMFKEIIDIELNDFYLKQFHEFICSKYQNDDYFILFDNLNLFENIPLEILTKYWLKCLTMKGEFIKDLNKNLINNKINDYYRTYICMLYKFVELNPIIPFYSTNLYSHSKLNFNEIEKLEKIKIENDLINTIFYSKGFVSFNIYESKILESFDKEEDENEVFYVLEGKNFNPMMNYYYSIPFENEIIFFPGTPFKIKKIEQFKNRKIITLNYLNDFKKNYNNLIKDNIKIKEIINKIDFFKNMMGENFKNFLVFGEYIIYEEIIHHCSNGIIYKGKETKTNKLVTIKMIPVEKYNQTYIDLMNVIDPMENIKSNYVVKTINFFYDEKFYYIVKELFDCNLEEYINSKKKGLESFEIKKILLQINEVINEIFKLGYDNIKFEAKNILIKYNNDKKTDYNCYINNPFNEDEINISKKINRIDTNFSLSEEKLDLLFMGNLICKLKGINNKNINLINEEELTDLLKKLLKKDPEKKMTFETYLNHSFFKLYND